MYPKDTQHSVRFALRAGKLGIKKILNIVRGLHCARVGQVSKIYLEKEGVSFCGQLSFSACFCSLDETGGLDKCSIILILHINSVIEGRGGNYSCHPCYTRIITFFHAAQRDLTSKSQFFMPNKEICGANRHLWQQLLRRKKPKCSLLHIKAS